MDNELRKKRVLEGIRHIENGVNPLDNYSSIESIKAEFGLTTRGWYLLDCNGYSGDKNDLVKHGFKNALSDNMEAMLHNWKRFYELIKDL